MKVDIFVDESGVNRDSGCSVYCFTICPIDKRQKLDDVVREIEQKLKIAPFHWREQTWPIKIKFLQNIIKIQEWNCILCFADNKQPTGKDLLFFLTKVLAGMEVAGLYLDGWKSKQYEQSFKKTLKNSQLKVSTLKTVRFSSYGGLRISDALAGLARIATEGKLSKEVEEIYKRIQDKKISAQIMSGYLVRPPHGR